MGKQFGIEFIQENMDQLCDWLHSEGFYIYGKDRQDNFRLNLAEMQKSWNAYGITKIKIQDMKPYYGETTKYFVPTKYPLIELSSWRLWIDSRAKYKPIWNEYEHIKKWVKKNMKSAYKKDAVLTLKLDENTQINYHKVDLPKN